VPDNFLVVSFCASISICGSKGHCLKKQKLLTWLTKQKLSEVMPFYGKLLHLVHSFSGSLGIFMPCYDA